jgi:hypothetical protein
VEFFKRKNWNSENAAQYFFVECNQEVDDPATLEQVQPMRERYDSQAEEG